MESKSLIILGAGGYCIELLDQLAAAKRLGLYPDIQLKGVLADAPPTRSLDTPYLGSIDHYDLGDNDWFLIAIGQPDIRRRLYELLKSRNARFWTFVAHNSEVSAKAVIGEGSIIGPFATVQADAKIGENVSVNIFSGVGHGAIVGAHSVLSPYSFLAGDSSVGERVFLSSRATIFPRVSVGDMCVVDAHSYVRQSVESAHVVSVRGQYLVVKNKLLPRK